MQDNDYNIIKPVENLQNVGALSPLDRNPERKRKQSRQQQHNSSDQQQDSDKVPDSGGSGNSGSIDYRA